MDRTSTRRPRRLRALLVATALSASLFGTALPAAASPEVPRGVEHAVERAPALDAKVGTAGWIWTRSVSGGGEGEFTSDGWIWTRR